MRLLLTFAACAALLPSVLRSQETPAPVQTAADALQTVENGTVDQPFDLTGTVLLTYDSSQGPFILHDGTNPVSVLNWSSIPASSLLNGDRIRACGVIQKHWSHRKQRTYVTCTNLAILAHGPLPTPRRVSAHDFAAQGKLKYNELIETCGTVVDVCIDDIHAKWATVMLEDDGTTFYMVVARPRNEPPEFEKLIGARISAVGITATLDSGVRKTQKYGICINSLKSIRILTPSARNSDSVKDIRDFDFATLMPAARSEQRSATGHVIATWSGAYLLLRTSSGKLVKGELTDPRLPAYGEHVRLVGIPERDLLLPILVHSSWQKVPGGPFQPDPPDPISARDLKSTDYQSQQFGVTYNGSLVNLSGKVCSLPVREDDGILYLESDGQMVMADVSSVPAAARGLSVGDTIDLRGICVIDTEKVGANRLFPRINGYRIVVRTTDDIRVLAHPPWWTPKRLLAVIGALLAGLFGILVWNAALRRAAARKGRELLHEQLGRATADLKTEERTRLAVELHDSLAQNLTGVSLEIDTATKLADEDPRTMKAHLDVAARSLKSCRDELRNCLWDLRSRALEKRTMDEAIRQTLAPHLGGIALALRFNVPRERISDNTAHAILRIIRELTLNAIRHGGAGQIRIAGSVEGDRLLFSVRDDGCGFDPDAAPGFAEGHYGLLGIQERVDEFEGEFTLTSTPGKGTKATVSLKVPQEA